MGHTRGVSLRHTGTAQGRGQGPEGGGAITCAGLKVHPPSHGVENGLRLLEDLLLHERAEVTCRGTATTQVPFVSFYSQAYLHQDKLLRCVMLTGASARHGQRPLQVGHQVVFA